MYRKKLFGYRIIKCIILKEKCVKMAEVFSEWLEKAQELSLYDTGVAVSITDSILTLSTCARSLYRGNGRFVLLAVHRGQL